MLETRLALAVCGLALFLSLPIVDFGAISARDQMARLQSGAVKTADFDWAAMAYDFGPAGREALTELARNGSPEQRALADKALKAEGRYSVVEMAEKPNSETIRAAMIIRPFGRPVPDEAVAEISRREMCGLRKCIVQWIDDERFVLLSPREEGDYPYIVLMGPNPNSAGWSTTYLDRGAGQLTGAPEAMTIESRKVTRQQIFVNGQAVGDAIE
jgi:hypothetical protein